jgi:hypothetical protein
MSKTLILLSITLHVWAEGVTVYDPSDTTYEVLVFGKSKHFNDRENGEPYNEVNPGIGFTRLNKKWADKYFATSQTAVIYKNSYYMWTGIFGAGMNAKFGNNNGFHAITGITFGLMANCQYIGPIAVPNIGVGYKNVSVYCAVMGWKAIGVFAGYRF